MLMFFVSVLEIICSFLKSKQKEENHNPITQRVSSICSFMESLSKHGVLFLTQWDRAILQLFCFRLTVLTMIY